MASVGQNPTEDELVEMIRIADADGTGDIDFAEFVTLMAHKMADEKSEETLKAAFSVFDTSGDGFINAEEMRRIMINVGEPVTLEDVEQVIKKVDQNGDGAIDYDEFTKVRQRSAGIAAVRRSVSARLQNVTRLFAHLARFAGHHRGEAVQKLSIQANDHIGLSSTSVACMMPV